MKLKTNKILEAIDRGIQLALDDMEDIEDNNSVSTDIIDIDKPEYFRVRSKFNELIKTLEKEAFENSIYKNRYSAIMRPSDILFLKIYSRYLNIKYKVKTKEQLEKIIHYIIGSYDTIKEEFIKGVDNFADLNWIDVSEITDFSTLFAYLDFYGDISKWDVSNATNMFAMFLRCPCTITDLSNWDVSNVEDMGQMFCYSKFNQDISKWDVSNVKNMEMMFYGNHEFLQDISNWDVSNVIDWKQIWSFTQMASEEYMKYRPKFNY